jgi:hypothetical protein
MYLVKKKYRTLGKSMNKYEKMLYGVARGQIKLSIAISIVTHGVIPRDIVYGVTLAFRVSNIVSDPMGASAWR